MRIYINIVFLFWLGLSCFAQISFNGCNPLFENQEYIFNFESTDTSGRNVYTTIPIDGAQACGGIGTCEFMIAWNDVNSIWEFIADDGNGNFSFSYLIYSNASPSSPNPPSLSLGTWVENTVVTVGSCGGDLSTSNATLLGNVQNTVLGIEENSLENIVSIYPNPVNHTLNISTNKHIEIIEIYDVTGKNILNKYDDFSRIDVSNLNGGLYFLKIKFKEKFMLKKITID